MAGVTVAPRRPIGGRHRRDAADQLAYEDVALRRLVEAMGDARRDLPEHGRILKLFVERLAVRQAAREALAQAFAASPDLADLGGRLDASLVEHRRVLDHLDELTRGLRPANVNQGQDVDGAIRDVAPALLAEIDEELSTLLPEVRRRLDQRGRRRLPSARYVLRHCPLHPGPHERRWYERVSGLVWLHAVFDYLRSLPVGGVRPRATVTIPGTGVLPLSAACDVSAPTPHAHEG
ncbi:MAG TPA: hypothetical protein VKT18_07320 [Acidimicrobiales bacterium]|nr:hypothetical protein [Acidimicrobiales bacterium]